MPHLAAYLPALLLLLFSAGCGTFTGAARGALAAAGHLALVAVVAAAGGAWRDPLRLPRRGRMLLVLLALTLAASFSQSPVPRAGRTGLVLLPAFVERCWPDPASRRRGLAAITAVVAAVAAWALAGWWWLETPGTSLPLGHHNLLAAWLVLALPLALVPWRDGGAGRILAAGAGLLALAALALTGSLSGLVALGVVLAAAGWQARKAWLLAVPVGLALMPGVRTRILAIATGEDPSALARWTYLEAAWRGLWERPLLGWGPGAASWTLGRFLVPRPGVHPPDQVVADPHSWPLTIAYETGFAGLLLAALVVAVFLRRRWRERSGDAPLRRAAFYGLLGFGVASLAGRPLAAPALPLAAALVAGVLQAAGPPRHRPSSRRGVVAVALALAMVFLLVPADLAHLAYDRALWEEDAADQIDSVRRAVRLDPAFPAYRLRLGLLEDDEEKSAVHALAAAEAASGVAHFWLLAGVVGQQAEKPWAEDALLTACELNPLGALAPLRLALGAPGDPRAPAWTARALLAEPRLLAAADFEERYPLLESAVAEIGRLEGLASSWARELAADLEKVRGAAGRRRHIVLEMDGEGATAPSLHAFRRLPWPANLDTVSVFAEPLPGLELLSAARLRETDAGVFRGSDCGLPRPAL